MGERVSDETRGGHPGSTRTVLSAAAHLDSALAGSLPCVTCRYELKGLSIRGVCPECGTAVRATILYKVDPQAHEFRPIGHRRTLALALALWSGGAVGAAAACWTLRAMDLVSASVVRWPPAQMVAWAAVASAVFSGVSALALIRPVPGTRARSMLAAGVGCLAYLPLVGAMWLVLLEIDPRSAPPYAAASPMPERLLLRLVASAAIIVILLGLRPNARELVKRSMVMRTGRVDRQTLLGMALVSFVTMAGDVVRLAAAVSGRGDAEIVDLVGTIMVLLGSALLTLGLAGALIDSLRIARAVLIPSPSLQQVLGESTRSPD